MKRQQRSKFSWECNSARQIWWEPLRWPPLYRFRAGAILCSATITAMTLFFLIFSLGVRIADYFLLPRTEWHSITPFFTDGVLLLSLCSLPFLLLAFVPPAVEVTDSQIRTHDLNELCWKKSELTDILLRIVEDKRAVLEFTSSGRRYTFRVARKIDLAVLQRLLAADSSATLPGQDPQSDN